MVRNKHLLFWSSLGALVLLIWAAAQENFYRPWRVLQREYRELLPPSQPQSFSVRLRQIVVPNLGRTDRCVTCHVGMAPGQEGIEGHPVFGPHPEMTHDPSDFGCTVCHGGQGRATQQMDAHGVAPHWPEPMIPLEFAEAGCGTCHTHLSVPSLDQIDHGLALIERFDCLACHRINGRGGTIRPGGAGGMEGPDLSGIGIRGIPRDWYTSHLDQHQQAIEGPWRQSFREIDRENLAQIDAHLRSLVAAPDLVAAKGLFHTLGCRGCHSIGGVGGSDGPDLTEEGLLDPARLDFTHVQGDPTIANWLADHFRAPMRLVPDSAMPILGLNDDAIATLTLYMLSLRRSESDTDLWPQDRVRVERLGEREFSSDGATLYGAFCAACHGRNGEGMRYPGTIPFPGIGNPDFLALASDEFLRATVQHGRPGRRMPAWGNREGGLRSTEIDSIIAHLRQLAGGVETEQDNRETRWIQGDISTGESLFARHCAGCHGATGEGTEAPNLANQILLSSASDTFLFETIRRGRRGTSMPAFANPSTIRPTLTDQEIESIVTFIRTWEEPQ